MKNDIMFAVITSSVASVVAMLYSLETGTISSGIIVAGVTGVMTLLNIKDIYNSDIWEDA